MWRGTTRHLGFILTDYTGNAAGGVPFTPDQTRYNAMRFLRDFVTKMLLVQASGVAGLLISGWILTEIQKDYFCPEQNFFTYRLVTLDYTPAWFFFVMAQLAVNGFWLFRLAVLEGSIATPPNGHFGNWGVQVPVNYLRVFAVNLVFIPASLFAFMIIRQSGW